MKREEEERQPSTSKAISTEEKLDEMFNLIKHLTSKMSKLEMENRDIVRPTHEGMNINQVPFKGPFQPQQILQRDRRNLDDQKVQPPLNNFAGEIQQDHEEEHDEINLIVGPSQTTYLTQEEYEDQLRIHQFSDDEQDILVQDASNKLEDIVRKYDLRPHQASQKYQGKKNLGK